MARTRSGYTLLELSIVVFVIGLLSMVSLAVFRSSAGQANQGVATTQLQKVRGAIDSFYNDTGLFPKQLSDLTSSAAPAQGYDTSTSSKTLSAPLWHGPYLSQVDVEPVYGTSYLYQAVSRGSGYIYTVNPVNWN